MKVLEKAEKQKESEMSGSGGNGDNKHTLVRFVADVPEFLNFEGDAVGPFDKGEIANLENELVEILQQDNRVEVIEYD